MAIEFGLSRLRAYTNGINTGCTLAAGGASTATITSGEVWIGGVSCQLSATSIDIANGAGVNTGNCWLYAYIPTNNSSTAQIAFATGSSVLVNNWPNVGTAIAVIIMGEFGTGSSSFSTAANCSTSGLTGARTFGRANSMNLTISYDQAMARGGTLIFPTDQKLYNGMAEGTLEFANISGANLCKFYGGVWASGGAGSGTWSVSATQKPLPFMIETQQITDGVTSTIRILKCYSNQITLNMGRETYAVPSLNFQAIGNQAGNVITWNI